MNCRAAAAKVIAGILRDEGSLTSLLPAFQGKVEERNRALFQDLCYGTLRWYPRIAVILQQLLAKPLKNKDFDIQALLAIGIYQLSETRIPDHAALNETVSASTALKKGWSKALVNGVLRGFLRRREEIAAQLSKHRQFANAHPDWLLDRWAKAFPEHCEQIIAANNQRPPMTLRSNCRQIDRDLYLEELRQAGLNARPTLHSLSGVTLEEPLAIEAIPGFTTGRVSVQDEAAQLAAELLQPRPEERILDACCAPGGKTCHILELTDNRAEVLGLDLDADRLNKVRQNLERLSLSAELIAGNACATADWWDGRPFDRILLDAPCSATGVIRRHPDIKLLRRAEDIDKLAALQLAMLQALWPLLKPGGYLLYATCSTLPQENDEVIKVFQRSTAGVNLLAIDAVWGIPTKAGRQLLPEPGGNDGFYYSKLEKQQQR